MRGSVVGRWEGETSEAGNQGGRALDTAAIFVQTDRGLKSVGERESERDGEGWRER